MKILHLIGSLDRGGAESILENIIRQQKDSIEHTVIVLTRDSDRLEEFQKLAGRVYLIDLRNSGNGKVGVLSYIKGCSELFKIPIIIKRESPDILHTWMYHSDIIGGLIGRLLGIPVIWGIFLSNLDNRFYKPSTNLIIRIAGKLAKYLPEKIVSCTRAGIYRHNSIGYPINNIEHIPIGVDSTLYSFSIWKRQQYRTVADCCPDDIIIGMVARWDKQKDFKLFLQAASQILKNTGNVKFWLAGGYGITSSNEQLLRLEKECGVQGKITHFGRVEDLVSFYSALDIFTLTSHGEGLPNVVLEAMSCCLPCVVSDVGDVSLLFKGDVGILLDADSPDILVTHWLQLIKGGNRLRKSIGQKARDKIQKGYQATQIADQYRRAYESVAKKNQLI